MYSEIIDIAKYHVLYPFSTTPTWSLRLFVVVILGIVGGKGGPKNELGFGFFYHRTSIVQVDILACSPPQRYASSPSAHAASPACVHASV